MSWSTSKYPLIINPYDSFMKKHLEHYGYFTGRNVAITRFGYEPKRGFKNEDSDDSDIDSDESDNSNNNNNNNNKAKDKIDWKNKTNKNENYKWWLKENLYSLGLKESEYQREPRWPIEMQVLPEKIKHIYAVPNEPEPFYVKTGNEETPIYKNEQKIKTVFNYNPINCGYFIRSRVGGNKDGCQKMYIDLPEIELDSTLVFESRFECGNLMKAVKISDTEYELTLRYDLYTNRHTQWFYFQIKNAKPNIEYRFTITNLLKTDSLYNMGMKPLMYSEKDAKTKNIGWRRWGSNIRYYKNNMKIEDQNGNSKSLYSLTWTCTFPNDRDIYYFAHCYPYTYTDLQNYLKEIQDDPVRSKYCKIKILCRSLAENLVHLLTITNPPSSDEETINKKAIVLTARVHPGETNSSWMMKGFLDFLLGNSADAKLLRDTFIFKIVPMLNPDGVIIGNYRCSLTGRDLNRNYKTLLKEAFPSIWHTREMVKKVTQEREVLLYCDLHGHSRKNNVFIYGCHNNKNPKRRFQEHVFPMMMSKNAKDLFSYKSCKFKIQKSKQGTGRIVMWNMGIMNSFTMEATFNGSTLNQKSGFHFSTKDLEQLAYHFCDSLLDYCDPDQTKCKLILAEVEALLKEQMRTKLESQGINVDQINLFDDLDKLNVEMDDDEQESSDDAGSDSSADDGLPLHLERYAKRPRKKRKVKNRKTAALGQQQGVKSNSNKKDEKKDKTASYGSNMNMNMISTKQTNETLMKLHTKHRYILETEKKLLKPLLANNNSVQLPIQSKSAKTQDRVDEKFIKKVNQNAIQLQLDTDSAQYQTDPNFLTFRYTVPNEIHIPNNFHPHSHLCEHHRKKLSDLFLLRNISNEDKSESDGEASDDEADPNDDENLLPAGKDIKPTFEDFVKKHVYSRTEVTRIKNPSRVKTSQLAVNNPTRLTKGLTEPFLEIKNMNFISSPKQQEEAKSALDYMPKTVLKQITERRVLNTGSNGPTNIINSQNFYTSRNPVDLIDNINRDLNRKSFKSSRIQTQINQYQQQQNLPQQKQGHQQILINVNQLQSTSFQQQQPQQQQQQQINSSKLNNKSLSSNNITSLNSEPSKQAANFNRLNDEVNQNLVSNSTGSATLFSSAFVTMNSNPQIKSQYEKITTRANTTSSALIPTNNNLRQKVFK